MKNFIVTSILIILFWCSGNSQIQIVGPDTTVCSGTTLSYSIELPATTGNPINLNLTDDQMSPNVNIGFPFTFYGNTYTQCAISSNNYIQFGVAGGGFSPWAINNPIPSLANPTNAIMFPWHDINPAVGGIIQYQTQGTAPNRVFIVQYCEVRMFSCTNLLFTTQNRIYEGSNRIETHITNKPICATWNNGRAIHGLHNANGTIAHVVPGRNFPSQWQTQLEGMSFIPDGPNNYIIQPIPYNPFVMIGVGTVTTTWMAFGQTVGTGINLNYTPTQSGYLYASVTGNACGPVSQKDSFFVDVINYQVDFNPNNPNPFLANTFTICQGDSVQLIGTSNIPNLTYTWQNTQNISNTNISNPWVNPPSTTTFTVNYQDSICFGESTIEVQVLDRPDVQITPANPEICIGSEIDLTASNATTYWWSPGNSLNTTNEPTVTANPTTTTTYTVIGRDDNGCYDTANVTLVVNPLPFFSLSSNPQEICINDSSIITASNSNLTYNWSGTSFTDINNQNILAFPTSTNTYTAEGTDTNGCVFSQTYDLVVNPNPEINFTVSPNGACAPGIFSFQDNSTVPGGTIIDRLWTFENNNFSKSSNPTITWPQPGSYDVSLTVTTDKGCTDTVTISDYVTVWPLPEAGFSFSPQEIFFDNPTVFFTDKSSGATQWEWTFGDGGSSINTNPTHIYNQIGSFLVNQTVFNEFGCSDQISILLEVQPNIFVYIPNAFTPNDDFRNEVFDIFGEGIEEYTVTIFNRWGDVVFSGKNEGWDGKINGESAKTDVYTYKIETIDVLGRQNIYQGKLNLIR